MKQQNPNRDAARAAPSKVVAHLKLRRETMKPVKKAMCDAVLVERVREALSQVSGVKEKRMFGSIAFMVRGKMCVTARAERIMCRIDPVLHAAALERPGAQTVVMRRRQYRGYVYVAADALKSKRELKYWIDLALDYNKAHAKRPNKAPEPTTRSVTPRATESMSK